MLHAFPIPQAEAIECLALVTSTVSLLGSCFILISYYIFPTLKKLAFHLIAMVALCDALAATTSFFGHPKNPVLCNFQALADNFFAVGSFLWYASIVIIIHLIIQVKLWKPPLRKMHCVVWSTSALCALLPLTTTSYGPDAICRCWIKSDSTGAVMQLITFYFPLWVTAGFILYVVFRMRAQGQNLLIILETESTIFKRLRFYPYVLLVCYTFATINRIYMTISGDVSLPLTVLHVFFTRISGFVNFVLFGCNSQIIKLWVDLIKEGKVDKRHPMSKQLVSISI